MKPRKLHVIDELGTPFAGQGNNDYGIFDAVRSRFGVYVLVDGSCGILYIGKAYKQDLKERITQYYTERDTGGTFRDNWCERNGKDFCAFKQELSSWKVVTLSTEVKEARWITLLEQVLIWVLRPLDNRT